MRESMKTASSSCGPKLLVCMTPGIGLCRWVELGCFDREIQIYSQYVSEGWTVRFVTYDPIEKIPVLPDGITAIPVRDWRRNQWRNVAQVAVHARAASIIKTNQSEGAWWYGIAARKARRPLVVRCGWLPGRNLGQRQSVDWLRLWKIRCLEFIGFHLANLVEVASEADREFVHTRYRVPFERILVQPNGIDTLQFRPAPIAADPKRAIFVGRLDPVKRLPILMQACFQAGVKALTIVGEGPERRVVTDLSRELRGEMVVHLIGRRTQHEVAQLLREHAIFGLTSCVEGHPKALLEAMSSGLACIGSDRPGIRECIRHGETGLLCDDSVSDCATQIRSILRDDILRARIGAAARDYIIKNLSLTSVTNREIQTFEQLVNRFDKTAIWN